MTKHKPPPPNPRIPHAVLAIDPGITTGWALLDPDSDDILGSSVWGTAELKGSLDLLIRSVFTAGMSLDVVIEQMPPGVFGPLATKLEAVRRDILDIVEGVYEIPTTHVAPGEWKPSRVARTMTLPWKFNGSPMLIHQKDALRMGRYAIDKRKGKS